MFVHPSFNESMGSAVELGAFVQSEKFEQKLIVCVNQKYARDKSFIMMGPVKHLEKREREQQEAVIRYKDTEPEKLGAALSKKMTILRRFAQKGNKMQSFENIAAYISFIPVIIVCFFKRCKTERAA